MHAPARERQVCGLLTGRAAGRYIHGMDPLAFASFNSEKRRRARPAAFLDAAPVLAVLLALSCAAGSIAQELVPDARTGPGAAAAGAPAVTLEEILALYNSNIRTALARIETLWVEQEIIEPSEDGEDRRAFAQLSYRQGERMKRTLLSSTLAYPSGNYQIASIVGPELLASDYVISLGGVEESEGRTCYALHVTATERDITHFDGTVWATVDGCHLVSVTGEE